MSSIFENESYISAMDTFLANLFEIMYVMFFIIYIFYILYSNYEYSQIYKDDFWEVYVDIDEAHSRKSREDFEEIDNNDPGHWVFWSGKSNDPQFQATNCEICGEYEISNTINAPRCKCNKVWPNVPRNIDFGFANSEKDGDFDDEIISSDESTNDSCNIEEHVTKRRKLL